MHRLCVNYQSYHYFLPFQELLIMNLPHIPIDSNLKLSFDKSIKAGNGNIVISNGSDTHYIDVNDSSQVTFSKYGDTVTINPRENLVPNTSYSIQLASGVFVDTAGQSYTNVNDKTPLNFATVDAAPQLIKSNLSDHGVQIESNIKLVFNEAVTAGNGNIVISNGTDTRVIDIHDSNQVTFSKFGDAVTINPEADLVPNTSYSIWMDDSALMDVDGHGFTGASEEAPLNFTTTDTAPKLVDDNLSDVDTNDNIVLTFNEVVKAGSGNIVISNGVDTRTIDVKDSSQVTFSKFGGKVTINLKEDLLPNTSYSIQIGDDAITDLEGNAYTSYDGDTDTGSDPGEGAGVVGIAAANAHHQFGGHGIA